MKKTVLLFVLLFATVFQAQVISSNRWMDLFSYNNVLSIREANGKLIAATENGIFYYTIATGEITKLSKTNGLHEVKISAFDYNPETQIGLVGYKNGSMDVITPDGITLVVDIPIAAGFAGDKKINHISISGNRAIVSVAYGVSVFNLDKKEFGDTCFFMTGGNFRAAKESVIRENKVYTVTDAGLFTHDIDTTFPVYSTWTNVMTGDFRQITTNGDLIAFSNTSTVRAGNGTTFSIVANTPTEVSDISIIGGNILVSDQASVFVYSPTATLVKKKDFNEKVNSGYFTGNQIFGATVLSGIVNEADNKIKPDGPYSNISYKIDILKKQIVVASGARVGYNDSQFRGVGYYHFDGTKWNYPDMFLGNTSYNVLDAVINPNKPSEIFFVNFYSSDALVKGIYRMENNQLAKHYPGIGTDRIAGLAYDENKNLFASTSYLSMGGSSLGIGYYYYNVSSDTFTLNPIVISGGAQKPVTKDGVIYIPSPFFTGGGMLIYNYNNTPASTGDDSFKILRKATNDLPTDGSVSAAIDKNDNLWIGTRLGLRVLSNPKSAITEDAPKTEPIIIEQNGLGEELFRDSHVLQIAVDPGNQKWVSVEGGGVFYLSSSGEQTMQHFTKQNSPLPNDTVTDVKIDESTGKVYFVTGEGIVVYQSDVVNTSENFGDVLVYPNPVVYANYKGNVRIRGLAQKTNIRITDAAGNLVHSAIARGGFYEWNLNNQRGVRVASGVYFVLMTNEDGTDKATAKIAVVN